MQESVEEDKLGKTKNQFEQIHTSGDIDISQKSSVAEQIIETEARARSHRRKTTIIILFVLIALVIFQVYWMNKIDLKINQIEKSIQNKHLEDNQFHATKQKRKDQIAKNDPKSIKQDSKQSKKQPFQQNKKTEPINQTPLSPKDDFVQTLGVKTKGGKFNRTRVSAKDNLAFEKRIDELFKPYNNTDCKYVRYGDPVDGGYVICQNSVSSAQALLNFGVQGRDWFGCDLTSKFKIPNHQYDCTNNRKPECQTNNNGNIFNYVCLGNTVKEQGGRKFVSLKSIIDDHGLKGKHIAIKIDIQAAQWPTFETLPIEYLQFIDSITMEVHLQNSEWGHLDIIETLMEHYVNVNFHMNNYACNPTYNHRIRAWAFEVSLVHKSLIKIIQPTKTYVENILNGPNNRNSPDCQMSQ